MTDLAADAGHTWGISGPMFLACYALAALLAVATISVLRRRPWEPPTDAPTEPRRLHPYELAYLNGRADLAADTVIAGLRGTGVLRAGTRTGTVRLTGAPLRDGATALDRAGYALAGSVPAHRDLRRALAGRPEMADLRDRLQQGGLVLTERAAATQLRVALLLWGPLLGIGLLRLSAGTSRNRPVAFLVVLLVVSVIAAGVTIVRRPWRTRQGSRVLAAARAGSGGQDTAASTGASRYGPVGACYGVALFGLTALWASDPEFAAGISAPRPGDTSGAAAGGGGCGGGGCGGGCGGCGG